MPGAGTKGNGLGLNPCTPSEGFRLARARLDRKGVVFRGTCFHDPEVAEVILRRSRGKSSRHVRRGQKSLYVEIAILCDDEGKITSSSEIFVKSPEDQCFYLLPAVPNRTQVEAAKSSVILQRPPRRVDRKSSNGGA
jgi:hypothetical protein